MYCPPSASQGYAPLRPQVRQHLHAGTGDTSEIIYLDTAGQWILGNDVGVLPCPRASSAARIG
jgi:hypothetical protein